MDRRLGNEPIWCGNTKKARKERRQAEKCEVIVKASRLPERELGSLGDQRLQRRQKPRSSALDETKNRKNRRTETL